MAGLREALEESYDAIDVGEIEPAAEPVESPAVEVADDVVAAGVPTDERPRDESGKFVKGPPAQSKPAQGKPLAPPPPTASPVAGQGAAAVPPPAAAPAFKAPQSWKPGVRERWAALPSEVQAEVDRREREITQALQERAEATKGTQTWQETIRPYEAQIRAAGAKPEQYVGNLLQTAHGLFYGPSHLKPGMLADLILQAGVPPADLDSALVARMNGQAQPQQQRQQPQEFRDPRLDQFFAQQEQQRAAEAEDHASEFSASHEFFNDVAEDVAHQIDVWKAKGNESVTPEQMERFYTIACQLNDDVRSTLEQRKQAEAMRTTQVATAKAKLATSSVRSQPTAAAAAQPAGRRAALESSYDELDR